MERRRRVDAIIAAERRDAVDDLAAAQDALRGEIRQAYQLRGQAVPAVFEEDAAPPDEEGVDALAMTQPFLTASQLAPSPPRTRGRKRARSPSPAPPAPGEGRQLRRRRVTDDNLVRAAATQLAMEELGGPPLVADDGTAVALADNPSGTFSAAVSEMSAYLENYTRAQGGGDDDDDDAGDGPDGNDDAAPVAEEGAFERALRSVIASERTAAVGGPTFKSSDEAFRDAVRARFGALPSCLRMPVSAADTAAQSDDDDGNAGDATHSDAGGDNDAGEEEEEGARALFDVDSDAEVDGNAGTQDSSSSSSSSSTTAPASRGRGREPPQPRPGGERARQRWLPLDESCFLCTYGVDVGGADSSSGGGGGGGSGSARDACDLGYLDLLAYLTQNYNRIENRDLCRVANMLYRHGVYRPPEVTRRLGLPPMPPRLEARDIVYHMEMHELNGEMQLLGKVCYLNRMLKTLEECMVDRETGLVVDKNVRNILSALRIWHVFSTTPSHRLTFGSTTTRAAGDRLAPPTAEQLGAHTATRFLEAKMNKQRGGVQGARARDTNGSAIGFNSSSAGAAATASVRAIEGRHAPPSFQVNFTRITPGGGSARPRRTTDAMDVDGDDESSSNHLF